MDRLKTADFRKRKSRRYTVFSAAFSSSNAHRDVQDYHKLKVWQRSSDLVDQIFRATGTYPRFIDGNLAQQLRRASVSVTINICEGCGRKGGADFLRFLQQAMGSANEVEGCLEISRNQGYLDEPTSSRLIGHVIEVKKMLTGLMKSLGWGHS